MDFVIDAFKIVGPILIFVGLGIWQVIDGNKSLALWVGVAGTIILVLGFSLQLQGMISANKRQKVTEQNPAEQATNRAYTGISLAAVILNSPGPGFVTAWVRVKNTGNTPAHKFQGWLMFYRGRTTDDPFARTHPIENDTILAPGQEVNFSSTQPVDEAQLRAITEKRDSFFMWGRVEYRDIYEQPRFHSFKGRMTGPKSTVIIDGARAEGWGFTPIPNGESAN